MNIAVLEGYVNNPGDLSWDALESYGTVTVYDRTPRDQLAQRMADVDVAVSSKTVWDAEALGWAPRLKMIALTSTGYNVVDLDAARARSSAMAIRFMTPFGGSPYRSTISSSRSSASSCVRIAAMRRYKSIRCSPEVT